MYPEEEIAAQAEIPEKAVMEVKSEEEQAED